MVIDATYVSDELISSLHDELHDRWFDLDACAYDGTSRRFVLAFGDKKRGPYDKRLVVSDVAHCEVFDDAGIGFYDIEAVEFDIERRAVVVKSAFPLRILLTLGSRWRLETASAVPIMPPAGK